MNAYRLPRTGLVAIGMMAVFLHFTGHSAQGQDLDSDGWQLSVTPYFWFSGIEGDVKVRRNEADIDVGFDDIWDALDFGGQVHIEAQKGRWGLLLDPIYLALSADKELNVVNAKLEMDTWIVEFGGFYRIGDWSRERGFPMSLDILIGGRYWNLETELEIGPLSRESDTDWVDPFVGLRWIAQLTDKVLLFIRGDVGGFAIYKDASEFTWNVQAGPGVKLSRNVALVLAYRALDVDKEEGGDSGADLTFADSGGSPDRTQSPHEQHGLDHGDRDGFPGEHRAASR
jgi:hypothetical protein